MSFQGTGEFKVQALSEAQIAAILAEGGKEG